MSIREWWRNWKCDHDRHEWERIHPPIWTGGYMQCTNCGRRDVHGPEQYGPAATPWIAHAYPPPGQLAGICWGKTEWDAHQEKARGR